MLLRVAADCAGAAFIRSGRTEAAGRARGSLDSIIAGESLGTFVAIGFALFLGDFAERTDDATFAAGRSVRPDGAGIGPSHAVFARESAGTRLAFGAETRVGVIDVSPRRTRVAGGPTWATEAAFGFWRGFMGVDAICRDCVYIVLSS